MKSLSYSVVSQFRAAKSCHWHTMEISAIGKLLSAAVSLGTGLRVSKRNFCSRAEGAETVHQLSSALLHAVFIGRAAACDRWMRGNHRRQPAAKAGTAASISKSTTKRAPAVIASHQAVILPRHHPKRPWALDYLSLSAMTPSITRIPQSDPRTNFMSSRINTIL